MVKMNDNFMIHMMHDGKFADLGQTIVDPNHLSQSLQMAGQRRRRSTTMWFAATTTQSTGRSL